MRVHHYDIIYRGFRLGRNVSPRNLGRYLGICVMRYQCNFKWFEFPSSDAADAGKIFPLILPRASR